LRNKAMNRSFFFAGLAVALILAGLHHAGAEQAFERSLYGPAEQTGAITDPEINEASGMAASLRDDTLLWIVNDSGNPSALFAIGPDGQTRARFSVADAPNCDWEDLAAFFLDQTPCLLIADTGDNLAGRGRCSLFVVEEPELRNTLENREQELPVKWQIRFTYPDGPRDCEAVAVDVSNGKVLLLSKRNRPPILYELPLIPASTETGEIVATAIGPVTSIPPPTGEDLRNPYGFSWSRPTAMDLSADGNRLVILTYKHAYAYIKSPEESWSSVITKPPAIIHLPHPSTGLLPIREALCLQPQTGALFITGEKVPAPVLRLSPMPGLQEATSQK